MKMETEFLSAYEKATESGVLDPRCIPQHLGTDVPIGEEIKTPNYTESEHLTWKSLYQRQEKILPHRACDAFLNGVHTLEMSSESIPSLRELSRKLDSMTGWKVARVPGLLHEKDFFELLSERIFPSTDYIRGDNELKYTPAPDCFHDIFGHMPMLTNPDFADFYQHFGKVALHAMGHQRVALERLHWFTVEFGLIRSENGLRIFGSGILSSAEEVEHSLSNSVIVKPFETKGITSQDYDVWHLQPILFAIDSFEQLKQGFQNWAFNEKL
ncbi:MAG: phenylalanine 4-monooxygenase [Chloroherpetonaceae bacterium]|nr:phenylalanine 4-monooxygenase [Chloroherpetonaceae bacterium]